MNTKPLSKEDAIKANIYVHSFLANAGEYNKSPHFRPENQDKVRRIVLRLIKNVPDKSNLKAIDFGCGTGFMIHLMCDLFAEIHGVDITQDMMKQVDVSSGNIRLHESLAENTPFGDAMFDFATAYSFMDHLYSYSDFLMEAFRVLKPGGIFYSDLNPNRDFILAIDNVEKNTHENLPIAPIVLREIQGALHNGDYYAEHFGVDGELLEQAEPIKTLEKGFDYRDVLETARKIGFSQCNVEFEWFLGQAKVMHDQSATDAEIVENYLNTIFPVSSHLFKYLRFIFIK
jgi:ubiquinone/menaquinone biosynthesis C-methylase UbiE